MSGQGPAGGLLLVEDNPHDEALTLRSLRKAGVGGNVTVVRDGEEALDFLFATGPYAARADDPLPAVVLLDLKLPKIDGLQVLKRLRADKRTRLLPVVILTSSDERRDVVESYKLGASSYVRKPVEFARFMDVVQKLGVYWLLNNLPPPAGGLP